MKKNKNIIVLGIYLVALLILILSSFFNPSEKYIVAFLLIISFPFVYQRIRTTQKEKIDLNKEG